MCIFRTVVCVMWGTSGGIAAVTKLRNKLLTPPLTPCRPVHSVICHLPRWRVRRRRLCRFQAHHQVHRCGPQTVMLPADRGRLITHPPWRCARAPTAARCQLLPHARDSISYHDFISNISNLQLCRHQPGYGQEPRRGLPRPHQHYGELHVCVWPCNCCLFTVFAALLDIIQLPHCGHYSDQACLSAAFCRSR